LDSLASEGEVVTALRNVWNH